MTWSTMIRKYSTYDLLVSSRSLEFYLMDHLRGWLKIWGSAFKISTGRTLRLFAIFLSLVVAICWIQWMHHQWQPSMNYWTWCGVSKRRRRSARGSSQTSNKPITCADPHSFAGILPLRWSSFLSFSSSCDMLSRSYRRITLIESPWCYRSFLGSKSMNFSWTNLRPWSWVKPSSMTWIWLQSY